MTFALALQYAGHAKKVIWNYLKMYRSRKDYAKQFFQSEATVQLAKRLEEFKKSVKMELLILIQNQFMQPEVMLALRKYVHHWIFHSQ